MSFRVWLRFWEKKIVININLNAILFSFVLFVLKVNLGSFIITGLVLHRRWRIWLKSRHGRDAIIPTRWTTHQDANFLLCCCWTGNQEPWTGSALSNFFILLQCVCWISSYEKSMVSRRNESKHLCVWTLPIADSLNPVFRIFHIIPCLIQVFHYYFWVWITCSLIVFDSWCRYLLAVKCFYVVLLCYY